jgi:hypothetical protein
MVDRRLYAQFTLDYADSHKIAPLSDGAFRAHMSMVLWSRRMMSDGRIPAAMALVLTRRRPKILVELTSNDPEHPSLVRDEHGDYWLHDFLEHQPSRAEIEAKQATNRANGAKGGQAKAKRIASESLSESGADLYTETETKTNPLLASLEGGAPPVDNLGTDPEPSLRCAAHTGHARPPRCGACKDARIEHEAWVERQDAASAPPPRAPSWDPVTHCEHGQLRGACDACDYEQSRVGTLIRGPWGAA